MNIRKPQLMQAKNLQLLNQHLCGWVNIFEAGIASSAEYISNRLKRGAIIEIEPRPDLEHTGQEQPRVARYRFMGWV